MLSLHSDIPTKNLEMPPHLGELFPNVSYVRGPSEKYPTFCYNKKGAIILCFNFIRLQSIPFQETCMELLLWYGPKLCRRIHYYVISSVKSGLLIFEKSQK